MRVSSPPRPPARPERPWVLGLLFQVNFTFPGSCESPSMKTWENSTAYGESPVSISLGTCSGTEVGVAEEGVPSTSLWEPPTPTPRYPPPSPPRPLWLNLAETRPNFTRNHIMTVPGRRMPSLWETGPRRGFGGCRRPPPTPRNGHGSCGEHKAKPLPPLLPSRVLNQMHIPPRYSP